MKIRNWKKYQHYKHRSPPWVMLHKTLLDDPDWFALSGDASKMLAMCLLLASESETKDGTLPSVGKVAFRTRTSLERTKELLAELSHWIEIGKDDLLAPCKHDASTLLQSACTETETETETEGEAEPAASAAAPPHAPGASLPVVGADKPGRGARLPDGWGPAEMDKLRQEGFSQDTIRRELRKFSDYWRSVPGQRGVKLDWDATFRNWIRRAAEFGGAKAVGNGFN